MAAFFDAGPGANPTLVRPYGPSPEGFSSELRVAFDADGAGARAVAAGRVRGFGDWLVLVPDAPPLPGLVFVYRGLAADPIRNGPSGSQEARKGTSDPVSWLPGFLGGHAGTGGPVAEGEPLGEVASRSLGLEVVFLPARRYIYLEDQYLTPYPGLGAFDPHHDTVGVLTALREALQRIDYLLIVGPNHTDQPLGAEMRNQFLAGLRAVSPEKVFAYYLARDPASPGPGELARLAHGVRSGSSAYPDEIYCHTKSWIVDDVVAKIGSANCCRRSYTHDSELDLIVVDGAVRGGKRRFALEHRLALWGELLNLPDPTVLTDHLHALSLWRSPPKDAIVRPHDDGSARGRGLDDELGGFIAGLSRHLAVPPEKLRKHLATTLGDRGQLAPDEAGALAGDVELLEGEARDFFAGVADKVASHLRKNPSVAWDLVDPDGR